MRDKMVVALRVLTCIENHTNPVQSDVESLQDWVDPSDRSADPDELACIVIDGEIQRKQKSRIKHGIANGATTW